MQNKTWVALKEILVAFNVVLIKPSNLNIFKKEDDRDSDEYISKSMKLECKYDERRKRMEN